ncbi:hypothetical protein JCM3765_007163 [Sporobolomyces pararoseus]
MQVRKEDAKLVRKLVIKGEKRSSWLNSMDGADCTVGTKIIEDLFLGKLLDISVVEFLHVAHLYEKADDQEDPESLNMLSASNLVELSIRDHGGGGTLWSNILADVQICPKLVRLGCHPVTSYHQISNPYLRAARTPSYCELAANLHSTFHGQLEVLSSFAVTGEIRGQGNLRLCYFSNMSKLHNVVRTLKDSRHLHNISETCILPPSADEWQLAVEEISGSKIEPPAFLSLPFSRSDLTPDILSLFHSTGDLGVELHFADEEEEDSISLIPRSLVKFVEKQKKLKDEKEKDKEEFQLA